MNWGTVKIIMGIKTVGTVPKPWRLISWKANISIFPQISLTAIVEGRLLGHREYWYDPIQQVLNSYKNMRKGQNNSEKGYENS